MAGTNVRASKAYARIAARLDGFAALAMTDRADSIYPGTALMNNSEGQPESVADKKIGKWRVNRN